MPLMDDISDAQKEFDGVIKEVEAQKKQIDSLDSEYSKTSGDFSKEVIRVVSALKAAQDTLQDWSTGYDLWISSLKEYNKDFVTYKKKSVEVDKFYNTLKDEKADRDKVRKKLGAGSKPSKADEIADAAFKKAETAYYNDPGKGIEAVLKDIRASARNLETDHKAIVADLTAATKDYDKMCTVLRSYSELIATRAWKKDYLLEKNPMGAMFDKYFSALK